MNFKIKTFSPLWRYILLIARVKGKRTFSGNHKSQPSIFLENVEKVNTVLTAWVLTATLRFWTRGRLYFAIFVLGFANIWFIIVVASVSVYNNQTMKHYSKYKHYTHASRTIKSLLARKRPKWLRNIFAIFLRKLLDCELWFLRKILPL